MKPQAASRHWQVAGPVAELSCALALFVALIAGAAAQATEGLRISDAWLRMILPSRPAAGYFTLSNPTAKPRVLVGAQSPACGMLMLHQSLHKEGREEMVMLKRVEVPAHGSLRFAPGTYHLMCVLPGKEMVKGHSVPVTLRFADGSSLTANFMVRGAEGR